MNFAFLASERYLVTARSYGEGAGKRVIASLIDRCGCSVVYSDAPRSPVYPLDVGLNALVLPAERLLLGRLDALAPPLLHLARRMGYRVVPVKQGYAACSCLVLPEDGQNPTVVCTADPSMARACEEKGVAVLRLSAETGILLPGYDRGFIGGAGGVFDGRAFFHGDPALHPALAPLLLELARRGIRVVPLGPHPLVDRGGIRVICRR